MSFTFILPLFPKLLEFYRNVEQPQDQANSVLTRVLRGLNAYKNAFARPINDRYDIVLLGGALGSLFSLLQAVAAPVIGRLSDGYGRRTALLWCMLGNLLSVALWVAATDFRTFLASRIVGGLSEGNVQLATDIATDISDERSRASTMALIGACFSVAFTVGPALGAALANVNLVAANPFGTTAAISFALIGIETVYLYFYLPETRPPLSLSSSSSLASSTTTTANGAAKKAQKKKQPPPPPPPPGAALDRPTTKQTTDSHTLLNTTHFLFLLFFSGMEFSLPFLTYDLFSYSAGQTGRLLGFIGLVASILQGSLTRRLAPLPAIRLGVASCTLAFFLLHRPLRSERTLYVAAALLAITSATVVTGLKSLASLKTAANDRGGKLGDHRSWGEIFFFLSILLLLYSPFTTFPPLPPPLFFF